jgi:uncharacterized protein (TIGR03905 family)
MEKTFVFHPENVCSREMRISYDGDTITRLEVVGGCQGNLRGISALIKGMKISDAIAKLQGIECHGSRTGLTSCPDQIALALKRIQAGQ